MLFFCEKKKMLSIVGRIKRGNLFPRMIKEYKGARRMTLTNHGVLC